METLTRADIIKNLSQNVGFPADQASAFLESTLEMIITFLIQDGQVKISSFGSFNVREKSRREGRNPKTKKTAIISARNVALFRPSGYLRKKIYHKGEKSQ